MIFVWSSGGRRGAGGIMPLHLVGLCLYLLQMIDLDSLLSPSSDGNNDRRSHAIQLDPAAAAMLAVLFVVIPISLLFAWLWKSGGSGLAAHREELRRRLTRLERSVADVTGLRVSGGAVLLGLAVIAALLAVRIGSFTSVLSVVTNLVGIYVATMSFLDFWRAGPTPDGAEGDVPTGRERTGGGVGGFWNGDRPWWRYPGDVGGRGRTADGSGGGEGSESPLSHIVKIVQGMPIEEYVPDEELANCTVSQLRRMIELRRARHHGGDEASAAASAVEKGELVDAARRCRNYDEGEDDPCCIICQEEYLRGDPLRILPRCGHEFHVECIDRWAYAFASRRDGSTAGFRGSRSGGPREPSCPLCKTALRE